MATTPIVVLIHFDGDPADLLDRFERARESWLESQEGDAVPAFYAACRAGERLTIVTAWEDAAVHRAFGPGIGPYVHAAGLPHPRIERMRIEKLGWN